ncbi:DUF4382 domain-containing protein [Massilia glaciei]|uniref:DUF4382 domain-containing protein n=1 Tax=Massilia glaciei TaxID=1524097 RepID=A0A2U2HP66_9BURK|nr:DUF4382 domain-containing protein [Massilia glaciei]PWF49259.1 DUF4382 domain-containing protein [Massilia glaciei]
MKKSVSRTSLIASGAIVTLALAACGPGGPAPEKTPSLLGTLRVSMTDAPACGYAAVNVTVTKVRVHLNPTAVDTDAGWTDITLSPAKKIDLLKLTNGTLEALGQAELDPGRYTQLRLVLDANTGNATRNSVVLAGTTAELSLDTPSALQSGIKLGSQFDVVANQRVDLVLDFDACKSILTKGSGKYALKPVVKVVPAALNGISGFISTALLGSNVMVTAQQNGAIVSSTVPNATSGEFLLARLAPGNYDVVVTADNRAASVVAAVPVATSTSTTSLSTAVAPLGMAASTQRSVSGTVTLSPASAGEAAYVHAKQSFFNGPTVVVKYKGADLVNGAYTIGNLPIAAPQYTLYSVARPLVFASHLNTTPATGMVKVEASAEGYAAKSTAAVNLNKAAAVNVNFALVP